MKFSKKKKIIKNKGTIETSKRASSRSWSTHCAHPFEFNSMTLD